MLRTLFESVPTMRYGRTTVFFPRFWLALKISRIYARDWDLHTYWVKQEKSTLDVHHAKWFRTVAIVHGLIRLIFYVTRNSTSCFIFGTPALEMTSGLLILTSLNAPRNDVNSDSRAISSSLETLVRRVCRQA